MSSIRTGILGGALAGIALSIAYSLLFGIAALGSGGFAFGALLAWFSIIPTMALGALSGLIISVFVDRLAPDSLTLARRIGALVPLAGVTLIGAIFVSSGDLRVLYFWDTYLIIPVGIYVVTGIVGAQFIYENMPREQAVSAAAGRVSRVAVDVLLAGFVVIVAGAWLYYAISRTRDESYAMRWEIDKSGNCTDHVTLWFVDAPGYAVDTCTSELAEILRTGDVPVVSVEFRTTFRNTDWEYEVRKVGPWSGSTIWGGVFLKCVSPMDNSTTSCGKTPPPIGQLQRPQ